MSSHRELSFLSFIPPEKYVQYFNLLREDGKFYLCLVYDNDQVGAVYLEETSSEEVEGVVRVFFDLDDLKKYGKSVSVAENIPFDNIRRWEMSFTKLIDYVGKLDSRYKNAGKAGVRAVVSTVCVDRFVNLDTLWTKEQTLMV